jgi:hypothetical protein
VPFKTRIKPAVKKGNESRNCGLMFRSHAGQAQNKWQHS